MDEEIGKDLNPEEEEMLARFQEELRRMTVGEHLVAMMQSLATLGIRKLGLGPQTGPERDLEQAKLAIEAFKVLLPLIEPTRPEAEMETHRKVLAELQMAYVGALHQPEESSED